MGFMWLYINTSVIDLVDIDNKTLGRKKQTWVNTHLHKTIDKWKKKIVEQPHLSLFQLFVLSSVRIFLPDPSVILTFVKKTVFLIHVLVIHVLCIYLNNKHCNRVLIVAAIPVIYKSIRPPK